MRKQKSLILLLIFAMALSLFPQSAFAAKKKVKLNKKTVTVNVGKTVKIKLQNNKKKVKWTVTSGKKNVTLSKKKKTSVPAHLQDAHYKGSQKLGHGVGYKYAHDYPNHYVKQQYLPDELVGAHYYEYGPNKLEQAAKQNLPDAQYPLGHRPDDHEDPEMDRVSMGGMTMKGW